MREYTKPVCRGSWALGTACGRCERCEETRPNPPMIDREELERRHEAAMVSLNECPPGLFMFEQCLGFKSEYVTTLENPRRYQVDAYVVASGEYFHGGARGTEQRGNLVVQPLDCETIATLLTERDTLAAENAALTAKVERLMNSLEPFAQLSRRKANFVIRPDDPILLEAVRALEN